MSNIISSTLPFSQERQLANLQEIGARIIEHFQEESHTNNAAVKLQAEKILAKERIRQKNFESACLTTIQHFSGK